MKSDLCYCGNVHPAKDLPELLHSLRTGPALVRKAMGQERLAYGLWMSQDALAASRTEEHCSLLAALDEHALDVVTINGFPQGNFHADVVKYDVYHPTWMLDERRDYTLHLAELLAILLPEGQSRGSISSLPLGYGADVESSASRQRAAEQLCRTAEGLAAIEVRSGKSIRLCLEAEPACALETGEDILRFWDEFLRPTARAMGVAEAVQEHLGLCIDTCHHAVQFEDAKELLTSVAEANIPIGKFQLSSAIELSPGDVEARAALAALAEPKFLHQSRLLGPGHTLTCWDDLPELPDELHGELLRVHYHLPIHRERHGALGSTQAFLREVLALYPDLGQGAQLEVETYTWSALPTAMRPDSPEALARCIAEELRFVQGELS